MMNKNSISNIVNEVYPLIANYYNSNAEVEIHNDIYTRLGVVSAMNDEEIAHAEYDWSENKIYLYIINMTSVEEIIRSLIHECVHSNQSKEIFDEYYNISGINYTNHPYELEAGNEEDNWKKYN